MCVGVGVCVPRICAHLVNLEVIHQAAVFEFDMRQHKADTKDWQKLFLKAGLVGIRLMPADMIFSTVLGGGATEAHGVSWVFQ